jgi:hypothetical protein
VDAIEEVRVLTSNYGAKYPSAGSGTTIVSTKSGTDAFHGSLYEFVRNEMFNAKGYFDIGNRAPLYRRNDFGGTIGGPVVLPGLYNGRGKTHFFFSEEARIEKDPYSYRQAVPSLAERTGDFSDVCPAVSAGQAVQFDFAKYPDCPSAAQFGFNIRDYPGMTYPSNRVPVSPAVSLQRPASINASPCYPDTTGSCGLGYLFANGFGGKLPGVEVTGNNAEYGGTGFAADTSYMPWEHTNPVYSVGDNLTTAIGKHNIQFGVQWTYFQRNQTNGAIGAATGDVQGLLNFSNEGSNFSTGNAFADFISMSAIASFNRIVRNRGTTSGIRSSSLISKMIGS